MHKSRILKLFLPLDTWEVKHLRQFLTSPFFNRRTDVVALLDHIVEEQAKPKPDLSRQSAFKKLFPNQPYNEQTMYLLMSYLSKLIEQFLAFREISKDKVLIKLNLAKAFREGKQDDGFIRTLRDGKKMLEKQPLRDGLFLRQMYDFEFENYTYLGNRSRSAENNLQELGGSFDRMYITEKLRQFCLQASHTAVFKKDYTSAMQKAILAVLEEDKSYLEHPAISIYYTCFQAITTGEERYFKKLREKMQLHLDKFTQNEIRGIYLLAINYCIRLLNTGRPEYIREGFELYKAGLEGGQLLERGEVSRFTFNNAIALAMKLRLLDWIEKFIENYKAKLPVKFRSSVFQYQMARLRYEQKRYAEAMRLLASFNSTDHLMNLDAKFTLLKIYVEQSEHDVLDSLLESMRIYLQRKEVMGYHKEYYSKVIRLTKKMIGIDQSKKAKTALRKKVMELKVASTREWFLGQIG